MTFRVVTVTTLLICAFGIELLVRPSESLRPLFLLAAFVYGLAIIYGFVDRATERARIPLYLQLVGDTVSVTFFVQITGGIDSPMSFLYLLPIGVASLLLYRGGGIAFAGISWLSYAALIAFGGQWAPFGRLVPVSAQPDLGRVVYLLVSHLVAMLALAWLASYLSERVRAQDRELEQRQKAVARLKALNENIIESINSGLLTTDLNGRVNFMNRGGSEITDYGQEQIEGADVGELFGLGDDYLRRIRTHLLARPRYRFELEFHTAGDREIFLGMAVSNLQDKAGQPLGYIYIFQDLTEIQALEQEVRLKDRMAALGEMAAGMAHELRNPLASISGAVQYLKGSLDAEGETLELMDIILRESFRLDGAIRDFLTFAKPGKFSPEPIDLVRLLDEHVKLLRKSREVSKEHSIVTDWGSPQIRLQLDANRMKQIFWNLTTNALKAMPDGGTLTVSAHRVEDQQAVEISFADEGVGMGRKERERYFQPFSSSFREGTGLGAAIVYRLIEEHDGKVEIDSQEGIGTNVRIYIPVTTEPGSENRIDSAGVAASETQAGQQATAGDPSLPPVADSVASEMFPLHAAGGDR